MIIRSVRISEFGKLKDIEINFSDSLNIINGDNESGKSTVLLFILYMFYGLPTRKTAETAADKARSISWESSKAEGQMDVELYGKLYRISRSLKGKGSTSEVSVFDLETGKEVDCESPADLFLGGISRETFLSCCMCGQLRSGSIYSEQVASTLANLSVGADESVDASAVLETIRKARKEYKHEKGKGGLIDKTADEISELSLKRLKTAGELNALKEAKEQYRECQTLLDSARERVTLAEKAKELASVAKDLLKIDEHKKLGDKISNSEAALISLAKDSGFSGASADDLAGLRHLRREYEKKQNDLDSARAENRAHDLRVNTTAKDVACRIEADGGKEAYVSSIREKLEKSRRSNIFLWVFASLGAVSVILSLVSLLFLTAAVGALIVAAVFALLGTKSKADAEATLRAIGTDSDRFERYIDNCYEQLRLYNAEKENAERAFLAEKAAADNLKFTTDTVAKKLSQFGRSTEGDPVDSLDALILELGDYLTRAANLSRSISVDKEIYERQALELEALDEAALRARIPDGTEIASLSAERADAEYREAVAEEKRLSDELTERRIKIESSPVNETILGEIDLEIKALEGKKLGYIERYEIYNTAYKAVEAAKQSLGNNFAPTVRRNAASLIERASRGKYSNIFLTNKLEMSVDAEGKPRDVKCLSGGTADLLYIALRLSLVETIFGTGAPLFLDETLSQLDDTRATEVLTLLKEFCENSQCLLFTCHQRENDLCDRLGITYTNCRM